MYIILSHCTFTDYDFQYIEYDFNQSSERCHARSRECSLFLNIIFWFHILYKELFVILCVHCLGKFWTFVNFAHSYVFSILIKVNHRISSESKPPSLSSFFSLSSFIIIVIAFFYFHFQNVLQIIPFFYRINSRLPCSTQSLQDIDSMNFVIIYVAFLWI